MVDLTRKEALTILDGLATETKRLLAAAEAIPLTDNDRRQDALRWMQGFVRDADYRMLGRGLLESQDAVVASRARAVRVDLRGHLVRALLLEAESLESQGETEAARQCLSQALAEDPDNPAAAAKLKALRPTPTPGPDPAPRAETIRELVASTTKLVVDLHAAVLPAAVYPALVEDAQRSEWSETTRSLSVTLDGFTPENDLEGIALRAAREQLRTVRSTLSRLDYPGTLDALHARVELAKTLRHEVRLALVRRTSSARLLEVINDIRAIAGALRCRATTPQVASALEELGMLHHDLQRRMPRLERTLAEAKARGD